MAECRTVATLAVSCSNPINVEKMWNVFIDDPGMICPNGFFEWKGVCFILSSNGSTDFNEGDAQCSEEANAYADNGTISLAKAQGDIRTEDLSEVFKSIANGTYIFAWNQFRSNSHRILKCDS